MIIYMLKQKEYNRIKVGMTANIKNRVKKLESVWGLFDNNSVAFELDTIKMKSLNISIGKIERAIHTDLKLKNLYINNLEKADGSTEFFFYNDTIKDIIMDKIKPVFKKIINDFDFILPILNFKKIDKLLQQKKILRATSFPLKKEFSTTQKVRLSKLKLNKNRLHINKDYLKEGLNKINNYDFSNILSYEITSDNLFNYLSNIELTFKNKSKLNEFETIFWHSNFHSYGSIFSSFMTPEGIDNVVMHDIIKLENPLHTLSPKYILQRFLLLKIKGKIKEKTPNISYFITKENLGKDILFNNSSAIKLNFYSYKTNKKSNIIVNFEDIILTMYNGSGDIIFLFSDNTQKRFSMSSDYELKDYWKHTDKKDIIDFNVLQDKKLLLSILRNKKIHLILDDEYNSFLELYPDLDISHNTPFISLNYKNT